VRSQLARLLYTMNGRRISAAEAMSLNRKIQSIIQRIVRVTEAACTAARTFVRRRVYVTRISCSDASARANTARSENRKSRTLEASTYK
jgi:hypothetical protein